MSEKVKDILVRNYKICYHAQKVAVKESIIHDMHQRMDEVCLIYSDFFKTSVQDSRDYLIQESEKLLQKEIKNEN